MNEGASDISLLSALELRRLVVAREITAREAAKASLDRIREKDGLVRAFVTIDEDMTMTMADDVERRLKAGEKLLLAGVPYALKDHRFGGSPHDLRIEALRTQRTDPRRGGGAPPARGWRDTSRQDQHARVRQPREHCLRSVSRDPQSMESQQDRGGIERRRGGSRRRLYVPGGRGNRRRRIDPDPIELLWCSRH